MAVLFCKSSFYSLFFVWWYFFGRKDAFPGADGSTIQEANGLNPNAESITIYDSNNQFLSDGSSGITYIKITQPGVLSDNISQIYTIKNPMSYLCNLTRPFDWYTDNESFLNNALWGDGTDKRVFDPCPKGWEIPIKGTWYDLKNSALYSSAAYYSNGLLYNTMSWYPACGMRLYDTGKLGRVGQYGYYWSSTVDNTIFIYGLGFSQAGVGLNLAHYRAYGFPVRCVQE